MAKDKCRNCGTTDPSQEIEEGLCAPCFSGMPMDKWVTPGTWNRNEEYYA